MRALALARLTRRDVLHASAVATAALCSGRASAAAYPERAIRIIVPFSPAGPTDLMARVLANQLGPLLGGTVIVENKPGAGGNIGIGQVAKADADGYTLLVTSSAFVVNPGLYERIPYDPFADFAPVCELGASPNVILADPASGLSSIADVVERARKNPAQLNYGSPGIGTTPHLSGELLKIVAGIDIVHIPFTGAGPAIQALLGSTTQLAVTALPPAHPHIMSRSLKALAVTGTRRWFDLPDVPTMIELGYPDFVSDTFQALMAPAKVPGGILDLLAAKSGESLKLPAVTAQLRNNGFDVLAGGPESMRRRIETEVPKWRTIISKAGIKPV